MKEKNERSIGLREIYKYTRVGCFIGFQHLSRPDGRNRRKRAERYCYATF